MNPTRIRHILLCLAAGSGLAQTVTPQPSPKITLADAISRARQYGGQVTSANLGVQPAKEASLQARAGRLPTVNAFNQYIHTEGNGTTSGVFVANDGLHVYNEQAQVHQEVLAVFRKGEINRAAANEAAAKARVEIAARGINATVIQGYYAIVSAGRKFGNAQRSLREAEQFLDITDKQEKGGEAAKSDVIKARIQLQQRQRDLQDAVSAIEKAKIGLGVLIFPNFSSNFEVEDDLASAEPAPPVDDAKAKASASSPELHVARSVVESAGYDVGVARYGYLPSLSIDFFYGINANVFAAYGIRDDERRRNLGYSGQITLNIPVWNWGTTKSKIAQAELRRTQAKLDLTLAERTLQGNIAAAYAEADAAKAQIESLKASVDLAAESLRLTLLRYQAGEAVTLEVVDAQSTVTQARNAYDDGLARYRIAIANIQTLTGTL